MEEEVLYQSHPAMFRNHPVYFVLCILLSAVGVGLILLLAWWLQIKGTTLTVTNQRTRLRKGILSKYTNEVYHSNVRNVQVGQTFLQRVLGVGYVGVSSAGHAGIEIEVFGIPNPDEVKQLIGRYRKDT